MKKTLIISFIILLIMGGGWLMISKKDSDLVEGSQEKDSELDIEQIRKNLKNKGQWITREQVKQEFNNNNKKEINLDNVELKLEEINDQGVKKIDFSIKNISDEVITLSFGTSQRYDFEIYNQANEKVYHYSEGKNFLQVIENTLLETGSTINYELTIPSLEAGEYTLIARLAAKDYGLLRAVTTFTIE